MSNPLTCPQDYTCTFNRLRPRVIHDVGVWWHGPWGVVAALIGILAIAVVALTVAYWVKEARRVNREAERRFIAAKEERDHNLAIEEQRTMQAEQAKGDPEMLKLIRQR